MKLLFDFFPVIAFFIAYKQFGILPATGVLIAGSAIQIAYTWIKTRSYETMHLVTFGVVLVFGGATIALQDPVFIKWKPTIVYWLLALAFLVMQLAKGVILVRKLLESAFRMPDPLWARLNLVWVVFFALSGGLNLYVAFNFTENTWVNFKLFGLMGLTFAFMIVQVALLRHYIVEEPAKTS